MRGLSQDPQAGMSALSAAERSRVLAACPVFSQVPAQSLGVLAEMMETERLAPEELLFEHGEPSDRVYVLAAGSLDVFLPGRSHPVRALGPGDLLGEYGMFSELTRTATIRAKAEAVLLSLDYRRFRAFLLQFPEVALVLLKTAVERLVAAEAGGEGS